VRPPTVGRVEWLSKVTDQGNLVCSYLEDRDEFLSTSDSCHFHH
jgi:hypothetical protein